MLWSAATSQCVTAGNTVVCVDVGRSAVFSVSVLSEDKARETSFQVRGREGKDKEGGGMRWRERERERE